MTILLTGAAGRIAFSLAKRLLSRGDSVHGVDNPNAYYGLILEQARLDLIEHIRSLRYCLGGNAMLPLPRMRPGDDAAASADAFKLDSNELS